MQTPTTAPIIDVEIGGKPYKILMGFRAFKTLNLNPFKPEEIQEYLRDLTIDKVCAFLQAGIANAAKVLKSAETPPTVEDLVDVLDVGQFLAIGQKMQAIMGSGKSERPVVDGEENENPTKAQNGIPSGQLDATISN